MMNKINAPKYPFYIFAVMSFFIPCVSCQNNSNASHQLTETKDSSSSWYSEGKWLQGLEITPDQSINRGEFTRQYHLKNTWWDEAFNFLKTHDLKTLPPGKYNIDSGNVFATIWEGIPKIKDSVLWEAHHNFNDLQYVIKGKAQMGVAPSADNRATVIVPYTNAADNMNFTNDGGEYFDADPSTFFIFSPQEMHRLAIKVAGNDVVKKIVIKVRVP